MTVFISHSFDDKPEFDNIADALDQAGIDYWKPGSMKAGTMLSDQLRQSIAESDLCIFVATRHSVASAWCGAELGAFWGSGKPVIIYVAEASLPEDDLPKQFKGHLVERRIARVVAAVRAHLAEVRKPAPVHEDSPSVGSMSTQELRLLIADVLGRAQDAAFVETTLARVALAWHDGSIAEGSAEQRELRELLTGLIGVQGTAVSEGAQRTGDWKHTVYFATDTGNWAGLARDWEAHSDARAPISYYRRCLVWRLGGGQRVETIALLGSIVDHDTRDIVSIGSPLLVLGRGTLGTLKLD